MDTAVDELLQSEPGFYVQDGAAGVTVHLVAGRGSLARMRRLAVFRLGKAGIGLDLAQDAELLVSELVGNAVRACGDGVPLVVEVATGTDGVRVRVHDPEPGELPRRRGTRAGDRQAEGGRGLLLASALAPGWEVTLTPVGKQVRCLLPHRPPRSRSGPGARPAA
ncbi:ATP-binding protein [Kitasatospora sp. NPDC088134]|uniref:ATP-binding protein n=1 Tax=Kitasatospora sp. NPDC088134 TaxID=3364071 RepID=UPI0038089B0F